MPDLDCDLVLEPVLCMKCVDALNAACDFKSCLQTEQRTHSPVQTLTIEQQNMELDAVPGNNYNGINSMATCCGNDINDLNTTHDHSTTRQDLEDYKDAKGECSVMNESCYKMLFDEEHKGGSLIKGEMLVTDSGAESELEKGSNLKLQDCNRSTQQQDFDSNHQLESIKTELDTQSNVAAMQSEYDASAVVNDTVPEHSRSRHDLEDYNDAKGKCSRTSENCSETSFHDGVEMNCNSFKEESITIEEHELDSFIKSEMFDTSSDADISCSLRPWSEFENGYKLELQDYNRSTQKQDFDSNDQLESIKTELDTESNHAAMQSEYNHASTVVNDTTAKYIFSPEPLNSDDFEVHIESSRKNSTKYSELLRDCRVVLTRMDVMNIMEAQVKISSHLKWDVNIRSNNAAPTATEAEADLHSACFRQDQLIGHMMKHTREKPYRCDLCDYACSMKSSLIVHMRIHTGEKPYKCDQCDYAYSQKSHLLRHMKKHTEEKPYKCDQCDYACSRKDQLIVHTRKHTGEKPFNCVECDYACSIKYQLIEHMRKHTGEKPYKCGECDYACSKKSNLIRHMRKHSGEKTYKCDQCDYACSRKSDLMKHMRKHTGEKPVKCVQCDYACSRQDQLIRHMRKHTGENPYKCDQCKYAFSQKSNLIMHMRKHTGEKPYKCDQCGYACSIKGSLKIHMRNHTGEKPYKCDQCDYACSTKNKLKKHKMKHTGEKPYKCDQCGYACSQKSHLLRHLRNHTGEKPYKCDQCDYACSAKNNMKSHMVKHTGEKPYKCDQCKYASSRKSDLIMHMRKHRGEKHINVMKRVMQVKNCRNYTREKNTQGE